MTTEQKKEYQEFLDQKKQQRVESGFVVTDEELNPALFPFQKYCVKRALAVGKFALFEDCGLGKTIQQLEWAQKVCEITANGARIKTGLSIFSHTFCDHSNCWMVLPSPQSSNSANLPTAKARFTQYFWNGNSAGFKSSSFTTNPLSTLCCFFWSRNS